jgi:UDP-2-acetamido-3-amino-2,3-dideoxy-glucuronate N-acetyltransferase
MTAFVHDSAIVEPGAQLADDCKVWHFCHVRAGAVLEEGVVLGKDVYVDAGVRVERGSRIQNGVSVYQGVEVGPWCFIGPHVIFTNDTTPRAGNRNWQVVPTHLRAGMSIGAGAIIRCGVTLGEFSMVGAGAIVTKDVPPFHLVMGFTAKVEKMICACGQTTLPFGSPLTEVVRPCCLANLAPSPLALAEALAKA